jgi:16S rRNA processing protein RimM
LSNLPKPSAQPNNDYIVLGTIVRPHGLKGEVKVNLSCSGIDRLKSCKDLRLVKDGKELKKVSVIRAFEHNDGDAVVRFKEVQGTEEAESLRGYFVAIRAEDREELPEDNFYIDDLLGSAVRTVEGRDLGVVDEVLDGLANAVLVVKRGKKEVLIPVLKSVIQQIDLKTRQLVVDLPDEIDEQTAD